MKMLYKFVMLLPMYFNHNFEVWNKEVGYQSCPQQRNLFIDRRMWKLFFDNLSGGQMQTARVGRFTANLGKVENMRSPIKVNKFHGYANRLLL